MKRDNLLEKIFLDHQKEINETINANIFWESGNEIKVKRLSINLKSQICQKCGMQKTGMFILKKTNKSNIVCNCLECERVF